MIAPELKFLKDSDGEVRFAFPYKAGLFYSVLGSALTYAAISGAIDFLIARFAAGLFGAAIADVGIIALFKRFELIVNPSSQAYRISKGLWPTIKVIQGSLDELTSVILTTRFDEDEISKAVRPVWVISVNSRMWSKPISIFESYNKTVTITGDRSLIHAGQTLQPQ